MLTERSRLDGRRVARQERRCQGSRSPKPFREAGLLGR